MLIDLRRLMVVAIAAGLCAAGAGAIVRRIGATAGLLDVPNERSSHSIPTPRGGGVGVVLGTIGALIVLTTGGTMPALVRTIAVGGGFLAALSLVDDFRPLSPYLRFIAHTIAAASAIRWIGPFAFPFGGLAAMLWVVGVTNAYNFMDGIDGIAASQAALSAAGLLAIGVFTAQFQVVAVGAVLLAVSVGFLAHNWSPARLFLGDVGSIFLGYVIAATTLAAGQQNPFVGLIAVALSWPLIFDTSWTLLRRLARGEDLFTPHRSHLYQRLVATGAPHARAAGVYFVIGAIGLCAALAALFFPHAAIGILPGYALSSAGVLIAIVRRQEANHGTSSPTRRAQFEASQ